MLNVIDTSSVSAPPLRKAPQPVAMSAPQQQAPVAPLPDFTISSIRVDNHLDLAILEFRSSATGDIMRQYPTEKQIAGYERAAQLESNKEQRQQMESAMFSASQGQGQQTQVSSNRASSAAASVANNPAPSAGVSGGDVANVTQGMAELSNTAAVGGATQSYTA